MLDTNFRSDSVFFLFRKIQLLINWLNKAENTSLRYTITNVRIYMSKATFQIIFIVFINLGTLDQISFCYHLIRHLPLTTFHFLTNKHWGTWKYIILHWVLENLFKETLIFACGNSVLISTKVGWKGIFIEIYKEFWKKYFVKSKAL